MVDKYIVKWVILKVLTLKTCKHSKKNQLNIVFVHSAETNTYCTCYIRFKLLYIKWLLCLCLCLSFAQPELFNSKEKRTERDKEGREISKGKVKSAERDSRLQYITVCLQRLLLHVLTMLLHSHMYRWSVKTRLLRKTIKKRKTVIV